ncbi:MAG: hypothetical protein V4655_00610 [Bdellovibrionota bacterium]
MGADPQNILDKRPLTKSEQIAYDHFKKNPGGRGFFSVAEIMARHQDLDEAIQLLVKGLERHPSYSVARVYLSSLYLKRGNLSEAWDNLEQSPLPLRGNLTAQIIRLKLSLLLGRKIETLELAKDLKSQDFQDLEVQTILTQLEIQTFPEVRRDFAEHMKIAFKDLPDGDGANKKSADAHFLFETRPSQLKSDASAPSDLTLQANFRERVAKGFFQAPIHNLFQKSAPSGAHNPDDFDTLTWARLLRRQGLYVNAADIYQRLVLETPSNELLRREYAEICELRDTQKKIDQSVNPEVVMTLEKVRKLDDKLRLLNELLSSVDRVQNEFI